MESKITRGAYGELLFINQGYSADQNLTPEVAAWRDAWKLVAGAETKKLIPESYDHITWDRKHRADGYAREYDLYDYRKNAAIVCVREKEGNRYGVKTTSKTYYLVTSYRRKITATEIKIPVAKYAKMTILHLGDIVAIATGEKKITLQNATHQVHHGYKAVAIDTDGAFVSVWDGSAWEIGKTRIEAARGDHNGGLYYYRSLPALERAIKTNSVFTDQHNHHQLAILEVEATGSHVCYGDKYSATRLTPIRQIASSI